MYVYIYIYIDIYISTYIHIYIYERDTYIVHRVMGCSRNSVQRMKRCFQKMCTHFRNVEHGTTFQK